MRNVIRMMAALWCALAGPAVAPAQAEKRVALVIGNSAYQHSRVLPNPRNDADAIAKLLRANGFADVTLRTDLDYRAMREAVRLFGEAARASDIALVYYAGHGIEVAGENYLIPIDAKLLRDADLEYEAVTLPSVLSAVARAKRLRVVILDACRNNPLGESMTLSTGVMRSVTRGLARIEPKGDVLVAYSARAGTLALDGRGRHSPYAEALLKHMVTPGLDVRLMFGKVRDQVLLATRQQQEPYIYGSLSGNVISLVPAAPVADAGAAEVWSAVKDTTSIPALEAFIHRFGDTHYSDLAKARLAELKQADAAKQAAEATQKKADEEPRARAEADRQRLALLRQEEERKRIEALSAKQAAEAAKKKADDDARLEAAVAKQRAEEQVRAKQAAEEAAAHKRLKRQEERKQDAEETKIAALPKIEKPAGSGSFAGSWTVTWHGPKCTPSVGSDTIRIEGNFLHQPGSSLTSSGRVRWTNDERLTRVFWGGLSGNSGSGRFRVARWSGRGPVIVCTGTWTAKRN